MAWYYMGQTYGQLNRQATADAFQRAVSRKPVCTEVWWALAYTDVPLQLYPPTLDAVSKAVGWDGVARTLEQEQKLMERAKDREYDWLYREDLVPVEVVGYLTQARAQAQGDDGPKPNISLLYVLLDMKGHWWRRDRSYLPLPHV